MPRISGRSCSGIPTTSASRPTSPTSRCTDNWCASPTPAPGDRCLRAYRPRRPGLAAYAASRQLRIGDDVAALTCVAFGGLLASPISWSHHWVWFVPGRARADRARRRGAAAVLASCRRSRRWWTPSTQAPYTYIREFHHHWWQTVLCLSYASRVAFLVMMCRPRPSGALADRAPRAAAVCRSDPCAARSCPRFVAAEHREARTTPGDRPRSRFRDVPSTVGRTHEIRAVDRCVQPGPLSIVAVDDGDDECVAAAVAWSAHEAALSATPTRYGSAPR